jgi:xanthine dehydrogenase small subunit
MAEIEITVDGERVSVDDTGSLLDVLREQLGRHGVKDGCSPQGQCGCCTVLVDGLARVSCVTPVRRVAGRSITTVEGLPPEVRTTWSEALCATGGSQCGFCTPGIVCRLAATDADALLRDPAKALLAHLCRCTGWQTIVEAIDLVRGEGSVAAGRGLSGRSRDAAESRARLEGGVPQRVGPEVAMGHGGFADDTPPAGALVAVPSLIADGTVVEWVVADTVADARAQAGKIQGRKTTAPFTHPIAVPDPSPADGPWARVLATTWTEPAYLETDASWCDVDGEPASSLGNGGAFGAKQSSVVGDVARRLAREHGRPVRVLLSREDSVMLGPKRPPMALGLRADGSGVVHVRRTPGLADLLATLAPGLSVTELDLVGPPTSLGPRGAGWLEPLVALGSLTAATDEWITGPGGGRARARIGPDGSVAISVDAGVPLDPVVLRSYVIGAAHQALGLVRSESITVDANGAVRDLTIRSFGVLRAVDTPHIDVEIVASDREPVPASAAVLIAVALAAWRHAGFPTEWPAGSVRP